MSNYWSNQDKYRNTNQQSAKEKPKQPSFTIKHRVEVALDLNLALDIGDLIVACKPNNPAIMAFGIQLQNLVPPS